MNSKNLVLAALTALTMTLTACGHHNSSTSVGPSNLWVGTENLATNTDHQGTLVLVRGSGIRSIMRQACQGQCQDYSPNATIHFILSADGTTAMLALVFHSRSGGPDAVVQNQVELEQNRQGEALKFRSVDLKGRLQQGGRLSLSSRDGLIGQAILDNL